MRRIVVIILTLLVFFVNCQNDKKILNNKIHLKTHIDSVSYSLGIIIGNQLINYGVKNINPRILLYAINQVINNVNEDSLLINPEVAQLIVKIYLYKELGINPHFTYINWKDFMDLNARRKGIKVLPSGLQYEILKSGSGPRPHLTDYVVVRYKGYLPTGEVFDNNYERSAATFLVSRSLEGWQQALIRMRQGAIWRIYLPPYLAFGNKRVGNIPPNSVVIYEIHLLEIKSIK